MKNNTLKLLLMFLFLCTLFSLLIQKFSMGLFYGWFPLVKYQKEVSRGEVQIEKVETLAIGNSQLLSGLNPLKINGLRSIAFPGASPIEYYYLLKDYLKNHETPKKVVIVYFPYNFYVYKENFWLIHLRYGFHSWRNILEILNAAILTNDFYMLEKQYFKYISIPIFIFKSFAIKLNFFWSYLNSIHQGIKNYHHKKRNNETIYKGIQRAKGHWLVRTPKHINHRAHLMLKEEKLKNNGHFYPRPIMDYYLTKTRDLLTQRKIEAIITVMPNRSDILNDIGQEGLNEYMIYLEKIFNKSKVIKTLKIEDKYFSDRQHLSEEGSRLYTKYFHSLIN